MNYCNKIQSGEFKFQGDLQKMLLVRCGYSKINVAYLSDSKFSTVARVFQFLALPQHSICRVKILQKEFSFILKTHLGVNMNFVFKS